MLAGRPSQPTSADPHAQSTPARSHFPIVSIVALSVQPSSGGADGASDG
jgi:hypothetical protein